MKDYDHIVDSDMPDVEKLAEAFGALTGQFVEHGRHEIELARAIHDKERLIKEQVKVGAIKYAREIFQYCYVRVTGRKAWDE